jgi:hypothetical protein
MKKELGEGGSTTLSFVDLPEEIHLEIAKIIDLRLCSLPSSRHARDSDEPENIYTDSQPDLTLARLTLVCKRLHHVYAPFSTWRSLYIEVASNLWVEYRKKLEPSPSFARVLKYPETGIYARELLIRYRGLCLWGAGYTKLIDSVDNDLNRFLANTPQLETVRCINGSDSFVAGTARSRASWLPVQVLASLSLLPSLRYLYLGEFYMDFDSPTLLPALHQVRILRYFYSIGPVSLGDHLLSSMPNIHTLHVTVSRGIFRDALDKIFDGIQVRCHFSFRRGSVSLSLSLCLTRLLWVSISQTPPR